MTRTRWAALTLLVIAAVALVGGFVRGSHSGGAMDPAATGPDGAHALVALLRERGVQVIVAGGVGDVERAARPDSLLMVAETGRIVDDDVLRRLARAPGDLLLVRPTAAAREALAPMIGAGGPAGAGGSVGSVREPDCDLREAVRAGSVDLPAAQTYVAAAAARRPVQSCYRGALVRYRTAERTVTVVGSPAFLQNAGLARLGNAALALNLTGAQPRLIWYAPQALVGTPAGTATIADLIPDNVGWLVAQLGVALVAAALWKGRRLGPLVAEQLPVVVRASETVEGLGRLYRSRRARDRAAQVLRAAVIQRLEPRLGLGVAAPPAAVVHSVAARLGAPPGPVAGLLFGPPPDSDTDLLQLARALDDMERQAIRSWQTLP